MPSTPPILGFGFLQAAGKVRIEGQVAQVRLFFEGEWKAEQLRSALEKIVDRSTGFWTLIPSGQNGNTQAAEASVSRVPWQEYDCRGLAPNLLEKWVHSFLDTEFSIGVRIERAPLMRLAWIHVADSMCELVCTFHPSLMNAPDFFRMVKHALEIYELGPEGRGKQSSDVSALNIRLYQPEDFLRRWKELNESKNILSVSVGSRDWTEILFTPEKPSSLKGEDRLALEKEGKKTEAFENNEKLKSADDSIELELTRIWQSVLKVTAVDTRDDFFKLGGHSLLAAKLLLRIHKSLGKDLSLASLLEAPTIELQAKLIRSDLAMSSPVRTIDGGEFTKGPPFFFFGGDATFRPLIRLLGEKFQMRSLGLQASLMQELADPHSMCCIAEHFVRVICKRDPEGPYVLGGWCSHGLLALETARQLQEQGRQVALVVLMQTSNPIELEAFPKWKRFISRNQLIWHLMVFELAYMRLLGRTHAWKYILSRLSQSVSVLAGSLKKSIGDQESSDGSSGERSHIQYLDAAGERYHPEPYNGPAVLFRGRVKTFGFASRRDLGWGTLLGKDFEVREVSGNHFTMYMHPHVEILAREISECFQKKAERLPSNKRAAAGL